MGVVDFFLLFHKTSTFTHSYMSLTSMSYGPYSHWCSIDQCIVIGTISVLSSKSSMCWLIRLGKNVKVKVYWKDSILTFQTLILLIHISTSVFPAIKNPDSFFERIYGHFWRCFFPRLPKAGMTDKCCSFLLQRLANFF